MNNYGLKNHNPVEWSRYYFLKLMFSEGFVVFCRIYLLCIKGIEETGILLAKTENTEHS